MDRPTPWYGVFQCQVILNKIGPREKLNSVRFGLLSILKYKYAAGNNLIELQIKCPRTRLNSGQI